MADRQRQDTALQEKKHHGEPGFPMVVYYNDFTQYVAERIPWHWHGELEFCVVTQGAVEFSIGTDVFVLEAGQGVFINADVLHNMVPLQGAYASRGNVTDVSQNVREQAYMFSILLDARILGSSQAALLQSKYVTPYVAERGMRYEILPARTIGEKWAVEHLQEIYDVFMKKGFGYEYKLRNLVSEVWYYLVENKWYHKNDDRERRSPSEERIYKALAFIGEHYAEPITLEEICQAVNVSKTECCRCFKQHLRMTPFEYLMTYRVNAAAGQLENGVLSMTEVAEQNGFGSSSYFCKQFKRYMGCTPLAYRKRK